MIVDLFDLDGTMRHPWTLGSDPDFPKSELVQLLHRLARTGKVIAVTGMSLDDLQLLEKRARFRFTEAWVSHAMYRRNAQGELSYTDPDAGILLATFMQEFRSITEKNEGFLYDTNGAFTAFFKPNSAEFFAARAAIEACIAGQLEQSQLRMSANPDGGITVLPFSGGKHLAVQYFQKIGARIRVAAGDTKSDLPLLAASEFPIVTKTDEETPPHPELVQYVKDRKVGYICQHANGHGLLQAITHAREEGYIKVEKPNAFDYYPKFPLNPAPLMSHSRFSKNR